MALLKRHPLRSVATRRACLLLAFTLVVMGGLYPCSLARAADATETARDEELALVTSILPQKGFVQRIAGGGAAVSVLVGSGRSPATYEPTPKQMVLLSEAELLFTVGVPFEAVWLERIQAMNPDLRVVATWKSPEPGEPHHIDDSSPAGHVHAEGKDPHAWTYPKNVAMMSAAIRDALCRESPANCPSFTANHDRFAAELDSLDSEIRALFADRTARRFMVYHPAWGHFAAAYGLEQVAIEREGKEPGARSLAELIDSARAEGVELIFVQAQFQASTAQTVAEAIGARLVSVDPLAEDYCANLRQVARAIAEGLY